MKFSIINATVLCFAALSIAAPLMNTVDIDNLAERSYDIDGIDAREWFDLEPRTGPFHDAEPSVKKSAHRFIQDAKDGGQLERASAPGTSAKNFKTDHQFHLDRQQPTNAQGSRKVAVQLNHVGKSKPSTVGQTVIHGNAEPSAARVAKALKQSVKTGKETHINHPDSKKAKRKAANIAANQAKQQAKAARHKANYAAGMHRAAQGNFKKGRK